MGTKYHSHFEANFIPDRISYWLSGMGAQKIPPPTKKTLNF